MYIQRPKIDVIVALELTQFKNKFTCKGKVFKITDIGDYSHDRSSFAFSIYILKYVNLLLFSAD